MKDNFLDIHRAFHKCQLSTCEILLEQIEQKYPGELTPEQKINFRKHVIESLQLYENKPETFEKMVKDTEEFTEDLKNRYLKKCCQLTLKFTEFFEKVENKELSQEDIVSLFKHYDNYLKDINLLPNKPCEKCQNLINKIINV